MLKLKLLRILVLFIIVLLLSYVSNLPFHDWILVCHPNLLHITYPHFSLVGILVSRYVMVNYHYL